MAWGTRWQAAESLFPMNRETFEAALDGRRLETCLPEFMCDHEIWHLCSRSGATKLCQHHPERFAIPLRFATTHHITITQDDFSSDHDWCHVTFWFRVLAQAPPRRGPRFQPGRPGRPCRKLVRWVAGIGPVAPCDGAPPMRFSMGAEMPCRIASHAPNAPMATITICKRPHQVAPPAEIASAVRGG